MARRALKFFNLSFIICVLALGALTGCSPTFPKEKIQDSVIDLCKREYDVSVSAKLAGNTVAVYLPVENLFDAVLNIDTKASKKINDVILGVSRIALSTDAKIDFYVVIAQDPRMPEVEIVYIRYVDDVKRFFLSDISRDEYAKRAVIMLKTPPQAEREKVLKDLFAKLNIEGSDEMIKEYFASQENVAGIGEISYWNGRFFIKEIDLSEFLASQIDERLKMDFKQDKDLNKWYELKAGDGKFVREPRNASFIFTVNISNRVAPLYLDSGLELDAQRKKVLVFKKLFEIVGDVLWSYKFKDFDNVEFDLTAGSSSKVIVTQSKLFDLRKGKAKTEDLI